MRVKFVFDEVVDELNDLLGTEKWIKMPCRVHDGDMIMPEVLGCRIAKKIYAAHPDNPEVVCNRFERDKSGIYQVARLSIE